MIGFVLLGSLHMHVTITFPINTDLGLESIDSHDIIIHTQKKLAKSSEIGSLQQPQGRLWTRVCSSHYSA